jgi:hypothetical protein
MKIEFNTILLEAIKEFFLKWTTDSISLHKKIKNQDHEINRFKSALCRHFPEDEECIESKK